MRAASIHISGIVQGVGFRPFVYNLAQRMSITGWVKNTSSGVLIHAEGDSNALDVFTRALEAEAPARAVVAAVTAQEAALEGFDSFSILASETAEGAMTLVSPDIATCPACLAELRDPTNRRFEYPFINCTNCGPRFTVIYDVPYDRPMTTMRDFPLCDECAAEYADPSDRRFHAQPNACFRCGPRLYLNSVAPRDASGSTPAALGALGVLPPAFAWSPECETTPRPHRNPEAERIRTKAVLAAVSSLLRKGAIVAIKSLGGFQFACDARNEAAVIALRERKHRWGKALAIMVRDVEEARACVELSAAEEALLTSPQAPIVLARKRRAISHLAPSLAPGLTELGVMLPYTPLHHLLLERVDGPLVMTSGNVSDEPILTSNAEALKKLSGIADALLVHDRAIASRYDDSVVRHTPDVGMEIVRRARGYAPFPLKAPAHVSVPILACGAEQKSTFCLLSGEQAFVSQHIGDLENAETLASFERTIALYEHLFRATPELVVHDLHPEYLSTKYALALGLPAIGIQHHHAHIVSVAAEHGVSEPVIGVAFDGTGLGGDGTLWGGELFIANWASFTRAGHLAAMPLPGGVAAIRRPARMAIGLLDSLGFIEHEGARPLRSRLAENEEQTVRALVARRVNTPQTSSMGRLFDAVAALVGIRDDALYEGQAAIEFEAAVDLAELERLEAAHAAESRLSVRHAPAPHSRHSRVPASSRAYRFSLSDTPDGLIIGAAPVIECVLDDLAAATPAGIIAARFHAAVIVAILQACERLSAASGITTVALGGGVFLNRVITRGTVRGLRARGLVPLTPHQLPVSDGGISYGQAIAAWASQNGV